MKATYFLSIILSAAILSSCGNTNKPSDENKVDSTLNTAKDTVASAPVEDKSKRESPPKEASFSLNGVTVNIAWGAPKVKGRSIWGDLVPYDEVWRTGANEASTIEFDKKALVDGKEIPAGKYALFTIPGKKQWTIIFNTRPDQWGAFEYEKEKDQLRVTSKPETVEMSETLEFSADEEKVYIRWEKIQVGFSVKAA